MSYDLNDSSYVQAQHNAAVGAVAQPGVFLVAEGAVGTYLPVAFADDTSPLAAVVAPNFQAAVAAHQVHPSSLCSGPSERGGSSLSCF